jgi:hypothetical protein
MSSLDPALLDLGNFCCQLLKVREHQLFVLEQFRIIDSFCERFALRQILYSRINGVKSFS